MQEEVLLSRCILLKFLLNGMDVRCTVCKSIIPKIPVLSVDWIRIPLCPFKMSSLPFSLSNGYRMRIIYIVGKRALSQSIL